MYTSVSEPTPGSGAQLNFQVQENCGLRLGIIDHITRDQVEADARDGCMRCHYIKACIEWASSYGLISSGHTSIKSTFGGNLEIFGASDSTPVIELQCWRLGLAPEIREAEGRTVAYGDPESLTVPSNAGCFPLPSKTSSRKTFDFIKTQLNDCISKHAECRSDILPSAVALQRFRLLEIRETSLKLVSADPGDRYACLSHCWGVNQSVVKTTRATLKTFSTLGVALEELPKTFRDAVQVCRKLDIRNIWIDSLCIVQDDSNDWIDQAGRMAGIFDNAYLTIAASKAKDSASGCFSKVERVYRGLPLPGFDNIFIRYTVPLPLHSSWVTYEGPALRRDPKRVGQYWPLLTRAWVFQEILLSKRVVHFGVNEVSWQCGSKIQQHGTVVPIYMHYLSAALPRTLRSKFRSGRRFWSKKYILWMWHAMAADYSTRELTLSEDRLPAIAAIAAYMSGLRNNDAYMAGLWQHTLIMDLTWYSLELPGRYHPVDDDRRSQARIPTWSWASCSRPIEWNPRTDEGKQIVHTEILTTTCMSEGGPFTGRIKEAAILMKAALIPLKTVSRLFETYISKQLNDVRTEAAENKDLLESLGISNPVQIKVMWDSGNEAGTPTGPEILALPLLRFERPSIPPCIMTALLIQATGTTLTNDQVEDPRYGRNCYKRVGIMELWLEGNSAVQIRDEFDDAREAYTSALVERVEALETHAVTLI